MSDLQLAAVIALLLAGFLTLALVLTRTPRLCTWCLEKVARRRIVEHCATCVGGYSSTRPVDELAPPPRGPGPGATR